MAHARTLPSPTPAWFRDAAAGLLRAPDVVFESEPGARGVLALLHLVRHIRRPGDLQWGLLLRAIDELPSMKCMARYTLVDRELWSRRWNDLLKVYLRVSLAQANERRAAPLPAAKDFRATNEREKELLRLLWPAVVPLLRCTAYGASYLDVCTREGRSAELTEEVIVLRHRLALEQLLLVAMLTKPGLKSAVIVERLLNTESRRWRPGPSKRLAKEDVVREALTRWITRRHPTRAFIPLSDEADASDHFTPVWRYSRSMAYGQFREAGKALSDLMVFGGAFDLIHSRRRDGSALPDSQWAS